MNINIALAVHYDISMILLKLFDCHFDCHSNSQNVLSAL